MAKIQRNRNTGAASGNAGRRIQQENAYRSRENGACPPPAGAQVRHISTREAEKRRARRRKGRRVAVVQLLASVLLMVQVWRTHMLPAWILAVLAAVLLLLWSITVRAQQHRVRGVLSRGAAWLLSAAMLLGCVFTQQALQALQRVTAGGNNAVIGIYVLEEDPAQKLADTQGYAFGCLEAQDRANTDKTIDQIAARSSTAAQAAGYESVFALTDALYSGQVQAVILNRSFVSMIEDPDYAYTDFSARTRCIYTYTIPIESMLGSVTGAQAQKITTEPFLIYLSGVDTRGDLSDTCRSDVNIIAAVNPVSKQVVLVNTPRDYYVPLAGRDGAMDKLTHAGLYGVDCSMATLGELYGVQIDYYMKVDFRGFISIIDALGGIDVEVDESFTTVGSPGYYDPVTFTAGMNHMDGTSALAFARERHHVTGGDLGRGKNQMKVIQAVLNKVRSPAVLTGYSRLMNSVADSFLTNFSQDQISALVKMQLKDGADWTIQNYSVSGSNSSSTNCYSARGSKLYVMEPDPATVETARQLLAGVLAGEEDGASQPAA